MSHNPLLTNKKMQEIIKKLHSEEYKDKSAIHMTANEAVMSPLAEKWQASILNTRYVLGGLEERKKQEAYFYKNNFLIKNFPAFDELEAMARQACKEMFFSEECNFAPLSGIHAMTSLIGSMTNPGDMILSLPPQYDGHYITSSLLKSMGRKTAFLPFSLKNINIDIKKLKQIAHKQRIKMVYLDAMHYFDPFPLRQIKEILPESILVYDASHVLGLIAGGKFQQPLSEGADILLGNTHKTLPGPQKAMILFKNKNSENYSSIITDVFTSSRHTHSTISLFITLLEMQAFGNAFAEQIINNTNSLAEALHKNNLKIKAYPRIKPQTHQLLIELSNKNNAVRLLRAGIIVNTVNIFDKHFIRLGTQQITRLGYKEGEIRLLAKIITNILDNTNISNTKSEIKRLTSKFNRVHYCFT